MIERYKTTKDIVRLSLTRSDVTIGFKFKVFYLEIETGQNTEH